MQIAPIRSPLEMVRAQARLAALAASRRGSEEELEYAALRDALAHYRCITDPPDRPAEIARKRPESIDLGQDALRVRSS